MRAVAAAALVMGFGCGAKPAETLEGPHSEAPPAEPTHVLRGTSEHEGPRIALARPALDVSRYLLDPSEHGRWPLTVAEHPVLEPHFAIAGALAQPNISWLELCERGAQHRNLGAKQDLTRYLAAWCDVANHDYEAALYELGTLKSSMISELVVATSYDAANILVERGGAAEVEQLLQRSNLLEPHIADLAAADYFEAGHREDAAALNALATALDHEPHEAVRCERIVRGIVDAAPALVGVLVRELKDRAKATKACVHYADELSCWYDPSFGCTNYFASQQWSLGELNLFEAYERWPASDGSFDQWLEVAQAAVHAEPFEQALRFGVAALEGGLRTSSCDHSTVQRLDSISMDLFRTATNAKKGAEVTRTLFQWITELGKESSRDCSDRLAELPRFTELVK